ncbi:hypothetical protein E2C01_086271 [Portunus trituberculatus]|uniref:Uncharacterized protein n=1 Tax=Portunus trituberculatus TaxID=210409 RepID=A0A5B7JCZ9_PORTR|nr:hypothetical protein [Portunus trituberculatus]
MRGRARGWAGCQGCKVWEFRLH